MDSRCTGLVVGLIVEVEPVPGKKLNRCTVDVGADEPVTIVTNAPIEAGNRVIVAPVGSVVNGEPVKKAQVGGVASEGMLCDAPMVWGKGSANIPAKVPDEYEPGAAPPAERPRGGPGPMAESAPEVPTSKEKPLFEMKQKLSKEEKKAAAEAKKAELAAKKALRKATVDASSSAADDADPPEEVLASDAQALSLQHDAHANE